MRAILCKSQHRERGIVYFSEISHDADAFRINKSPSFKMDRMMLDSAAHDQSI